MQQTMDRQGGGVEFARVGGDGGDGAFLGARGFRQFPDWVGSTTSWDIEAGTGPYVVAEAIEHDGSHSSNNTVGAGMIV